MKIQILFLLIVALATNTQAEAKPRHSVRTARDAATSQKDTQKRDPASANYSDRVFEARITSESNYVDNFHFYLTPSLSYSDQSIRGFEINENYDYENFKANTALDPTSPTNTYNDTYFKISEFSEGVSLLDLPSFIPLKDPIVIQIDKAFNNDTGGKVYIYFMRTYKLLGSDFRALTLNFSKKGAKIVSKCEVPGVGNVSFDNLDITIKTNMANLPVGIGSITLKQGKVTMGTIDIAKLPKAP